VDEYYDDEDPDYEPEDDEEESVLKQKRGGKGEGEDNNSKIEEIEGKINKFLIDNPDLVLNNGELELELFIKIIEVTNNKSQYYEPKQIKLCSNNQFYR
jgi:hypothetical protein